MFGTYCRLGVPVCSTDREVIRAARGLLSARARYGRALRAERHAFLRQMLKCFTTASRISCASTGSDWRPPRLTGGSASFHLLIPSVALRLPQLASGDRRQRSRRSAGSPGDRRGEARSPPP